MGWGRHGGQGLTIINRVVVPGPRQVLLHVKIAELNRTAIRQIGVSWLDTKGKSIIGSSAGGVGGVGATATCQSQHRGVQSDRPPLAGDLDLQRHRNRIEWSVSSSASSTRGTSRCSSTPCERTAWPRSWLSRTWWPWTANPHGSWWAAISPIRFRRARRFPAARPWSPSSSPASARSSTSSPRSLPTT